MEKFKKFLKLFNYMDLNLYATSYKSAFIRMAVSLSIVLIVCLIRFNITISNPVINIISAIFILGIVILSILCFFVAAVECLQVGENRKKEKTRK